MRTIRRRAGFAAIFWAFPAHWALVHAQDDAPLVVRAQTVAGAHYVGEAIEVRVGVTAAGERPELLPPRVAGADWTLVGRSFRPLGVSGIGDVVTERNQFLWRFRLVAQRAGVLDVPPFRAKLGARVGSSAPFRIAIEPPPLAGRPAAFLGGVGPFEVAARARPTTLRAGQEFEYRIEVSGPGARGATRAPALEGMDRMALGLRVEPLPGEFVAEPPSRVFRFLARPTRAGAAVLPPVAVAGFDPGSGRYVTKVTASVPVRVVAVPAFDPSRFSYRTAPKPAGGRTRGREVVFLGSGTGLALALAALIAIRKKASPRLEPGRLARRIARSFEAGEGPETTARKLAAGFVEYLAATTGRPEGALTPGEARRGLFQAIGSEELARRAERLAEQSDRILFAHETRSTEAEALDAAARQFFRDLARGKRKPAGGGEGKPREAVETAT